MRADFNTNTFCLGLTQSGAHGDKSQTSTVNTSEPERPASSAPATGAAFNLCDGRAGGTFALVLLNLAATRDCFIGKLAALVFTADADCPIGCRYCVIGRPVGTARRTVSAAREIVPLPLEERAA